MPGLVVMTGAVFNFATFLVKFPPSIISGLLCRRGKLIITSEGINSEWRVSLMFKMPWALSSQHCRWLASQNVTFSKKGTCANLNVAFHAQWSGKISKGLIYMRARLKFPYPMHLLVGEFTLWISLFLKRSSHQIHFQLNPQCFIQWTSFSSSQKIDGNVQVQSNFTKEI